jgi:triacylglycerol esterase/lipase EstA (alpha/beta hydrolase family)
MLARLQQVTTLGLLAAAAVWSAYFLSLDQPAWALGGAFFLLFFYALVLAVEFMLMWCVNRWDPTLRPTFAQVLKAWWGEVLTAPRVFCWNQPFRSMAEPDHLPVGVRRRGVVLVHGFVCNRGVWNPMMRKLRARGIPFVAVNLEPVFCSIDRYVDVVEAGVRRVASATGLPPVIVAHSMGGLAVRAWMTAHHADDRVHHVITIGSPHRGTLLGRFGYTANTRQMRMGCDWQHRLAQGEYSERFSRYTCFYGHCDNMVFPARNATLPGADNRHIAGIAHVHMVDYPEVAEEILRWVDTPEGAD